MSSDQTTETPSQSSSTSQSGKEWGAAVLKILGAIAVIFPIAWAAYTYYHQEFQQRRQDFLRAYDIVHGTLGKGITDSIDEAIKPIYNSSDDKLAKARQSADVAKVQAGESAEAAAIADIQQWLINNIFVKDKNPLHDRQIQNYQQALRNLIFLYQYAKTDPCTALVVLYRFRENAYLFWYYYPGGYNFDRSKVTASPEPDPAHQLVEEKWLETQKDQCTLEPLI